MNYIFTQQVKEHFESKGYVVNSESSKSSDYLRITNPSDKYGFKFVVRLSDHDALTGRSECADLNYITTEWNNGMWEGKFESRYGFDGDDFDTTGDYPYDTEAERNEACIKVMISEIESKLDF